MRTTLDIDDDILRAAKELARSEKKTTGQVVSELARRALTRQSEGKATIRNGFELLPAPGEVVTAELIDRLLEEDV